MDYGNSDAAKAFVAQMLERITVDDPATFSIVRQLAVLEDQLAECIETLRREGQFFNDRFGKPKEHPAAKRQIALHNEYGKLYSKLGLDRAPDKQPSLFD